MSRVHAQRVQEQLKCGLSLAEVERLVGGPYFTIEKDPRATHVFRDGFTDLWLRFENDRLQSSQIINVVGFTGTRADPRIEHCGKGT